MVSDLRMDMCMIQELEKQAVDMNKKALDAAAAATAAKVRMHACTHARTHARERTADTFYTHVRHTHIEISRLGRLSKAKATAREGARLVRCSRCLLTHELIHTRISLKWKRQRPQLFPLPTGSEFTLSVAPRDCRVPCVCPLACRWHSSRCS